MLYSVFSPSAPHIPLQAWLATKQEPTMRADIHPKFRDVCFVDLSTGEKLIIKSTAQTKETVKLDDGTEVPLYKVETTANSHPFYTGTQKSIDTLGGRVEKFRQKFAKTGTPAKKAA
jgi:large subunit ribosomal protein L31